MPVFVNPPEPVIAAVLEIVVAFEPSIVKLKPPFVTPPLNVKPPVPDDVIVEL